MAEGPTRCRTPSEAYRTVDDRTGSLVYRQGIDKRPKFTGARVLDARPNQRRNRRAVVGRSRTVVGTKLTGLDEMRLANHPEVKLSALLFG